MQTTYLSFASNSNDSRPRVSCDFTATVGTKHTSRLAGI